MGYSYNEALVIVFISGIFFIVITAVGLREAIIRSIPDAVKLAIVTGNRSVYHDHRFEECGTCRKQSVHAGQHGRLCTVEK